jgi:hypothetical protein
MDKEIDMKWKVYRVVPDGHIGTLDPGQEYVTLGSVEIIQECNTKEEALICELYHKHVETGKKLFEALKPSPDEIKFINDELIDIGWEDLICDPDNPEGGGDLGLLAVNIYEMREAVKESDDAKS